MSLNSQLSKEARFVHKIFSLAAQQAAGYTARSTGEDKNVIVAGGAIRDVYFERETRDLDLYFNSDVIGLRSFAAALKRLPIASLARAAGFSSVSLIRLSDGSVMGSTDPDDGEDWGDVSEDAREALDEFIAQFQHFRHSGYSFADAITLSHNRLPAVAQLLHNPSNHRYTLHGVKTAMHASESGSGSGSKMGSSHPLKDVEPFRFEFDDCQINIELMAVDMIPVDYVMSHFAVKLSRAYYDGAACHFTSDFLSDARNKTITVACACEHARFERLFSYYLPKIQYYFPDFSIRIDLKAMNPSGW